MMLHVRHVPHDVAPVHPLQRLHYAASREAAGRAAEGASGSGGLPSVRIAADLPPAAADGGRLSVTEADANRETRTSSG